MERAKVWPGAGAGLCCAPEAGSQHVPRDKSGKMEKNLMALNRGGGVLRRTGETREPSEQLQKCGCPGATKARVASKAKGSLDSKRESHGRISTAFE